MSTFNEHVVVGDLMKSVTFLRLSETGESLVEIARDHESAWTTDVCCLSDTELLASDNLGNILLMTRVVDAHFKERWSIERTGAFHLGQVVNRILPGTLARQYSSSGHKPSCSGHQSPTADTQSSAPEYTFDDPHIVATTCGGLYQLLRLSPPQTRLLRALERNLAILLDPVGKLDHAEWRAVSTERRKLRPESETFIDGDLILKFAEMPEPVQQVLVTGGNGCERIAADATLKDVSDLVDYIISICH